MPGYLVLLLSHGTKLLPLHFPVGGGVQCPPDYTHFSTYYFSAMILRDGGYPGLPACTDYDICTNITGREAPKVLI